MIDQTIDASAAAPSTPAAAATWLAEAKSNPEWRDGLLAGNPKHLNEFKSLHEMIDRGDNYDLAIAGQLAPGEIQSSDHVQNIGAASMLTEAGVRPEIVRDVLAGTHTVTAEEYAKVKQFKTDRMSDKEWQAKLLSNDSTAKREWHLMNVVLTGDIRGEKAA
jgi:hypothetical protein